MIKMHFKIYIFFIITLLQSALLKMLHKCVITLILSASMVFLKTLIISSVHSIQLSTLLFHKDSFNSQGTHILIKMYNLNALLVALDKSVC